MRIAVNGFGRIGKNFVRIFMESPKDIELVAINIGPADVSAVAYGFKYDSIMGTFKGDVHIQNNTLIINNKKILLYAELDARKLPWGDLEIDWVIDVTGKYTQAGQAQAHLDAGAKKVLISAPSEGEDVSIIPGVNYEMYKLEHRIVSLGSCTTNALLPMLKVMHDNFTILNAQVLTVHSYTNSQALLDVNAQSKDPRKSRAAALNIIPTSTGASKMVIKVIPELGPRVTASALRVPTPTVSILDITCLVAKPCSIDNIHEAYKQALQNDMRGILDISFEPLVSCDYRLNSHSVTIDALLTSVSGQLCKVFGWYDNEWGYSSRLKDFLFYAAKK